MKLQYALAPEDYARLREATSRRFTKISGGAWMLRGLHALFWIALGLVIAAVAWMVEEQPSVKPYLFVISTFGGIALVAKLVLRTATERAFRNVTLGADGSIARQVELELLESGIAVRVRDVAIQIPWRAIVGQSQDDKNLYLFLSDLYAIPIPRTVATNIAALLESHLSHLVDA